MNSFSFEPISPPPPPRNSLSFSPAPRTHSSASNRITFPKGTVGCYDITELNEQMRYFGISEETKNTLRRKPRPTRPSVSRLGTTPCDTLYTNKNTLSLPREHSKYVSKFPKPTRSCYVDFTGSFKDSVQAKPLPLVTRHCSAPAIRQRFPRNRLATSKVTRGKQVTPRKQDRKSPESVQIKDGLLVIANGQIVDLKKDKKRSQELNENERKRLRKEMRRHLDIVRSFDDLFEQFDATKRQLEEMKAS